MSRHDTEPYDDEDEEDIADDVLEEIVTKFSDAGKNAALQHEAVAVVSSYFESEGWTVVAAGSDRPTYDLLCTREEKELHVKVRGTSDEQIRFIMSDQELESASDDDDYLVCVVTGAGTDDAALSVFDPDELMDDFLYRPTHWAFQHKDEVDE
ncbi:MAG: DUF3883 domain-containing protein [Bacteroidetes bacterium]|nr:DUF3883 domain-containing protein [Bacteroidota bacterium]